MTFVEFTLYMLASESDEMVAINVDAIGYVAQKQDYTVIMVTGGEGGALLVAERYDDVIKAIHKADGDIE